MRVVLPLRHYLRYYFVGIVPAVLAAAVVRYAIQCFNVSTNCDMQQRYDEHYEQRHAEITCFKANIRQTDWFDRWSLITVLIVLALCWALVALVVRDTERMRRVGVETDGTPPAEALRIARANVRGWMWVFVVIAVLMVAMAITWRIILW